MKGCLVATSASVPCAVFPPLGIGEPARGFPGLLQHSLLAKRPSVAASLASAHPGTSPFGACNLQLCSLAHCTALQGMSIPDREATTQASNKASQRTRQGCNKASKQER
eukprot:1256782-Alexandrium_andersonii.AAC.1